MTNQEIRAEPVWGKERVPLLLDSKEVAAILRIAVKTVNKLVRQGKLAYAQPCLPVLRVKTGYRGGLT